jgi:hypothetical protein
MENLYKALIIFFYIYLICALINIIDSYLEFKRNLNEENYTTCINKFKNEISIALFPGVNILCFCIIIFGIVVFYYDEILDRIANKIGKNIVSSQKELKTLKKALIQSGYFKSEEEIQIFINGKLIIDKLSE